MKHFFWVVCVSSLLWCSPIVGEAAELSPACAAEKENLQQQAKAAYQRWDTDLYNELKEQVRATERFCTDEKLLQKIESRYARQQKKVFSLQQKLDEATTSKKSKAWVDTQAENLRSAQESLRGIEEEKNALLSLMGREVEKQETVLEEEEPLAVDSPAYSE